MATAKTIKTKISGIPHDITLMKYKNGNNTYTIHTVYWVHQGIQTKIWPTYYDATLEVWGDNVSLPKNVGANGGSVNIKWYLTLKYPDTNEIVKYNGITYNRLDVTSQINTNSRIVGYDNLNDGQYYVDYTQNNPAKVTAPNRGTNGLGSYGSGNPISDGGWKYYVSGEWVGTINGISVAVANGSAVVLEQDANTYDYDMSISVNPYYTGFTLKYYNDHGLTDQNSSSNRVSYTSSIVYPLAQATAHYIYLFASGSSYDKRVVDHYPNNPTWEIVNPSTHTWATIDSSNGQVTVSENTSTSGRSVQIRITPNWYNNNGVQLSATCTIYQAGKPSS